MGHIELINPYSLEKIGNYDLETFDHQHQKVLSLIESQKVWRSINLEKRLELIKEGLTYFEKNKELIATDICEQMGRPLHFARGEINGFFERANYLCENATSILAPDLLTDKEGFERSIVHDPLGVIFVISAWNYPLLITVNSVVPALLSGNTVLLKHSSITPKIGKHFENAFKTLGEFDNLLINSVIDHETTGKVIEDLPINHVVFTGSVSGGRQIINHTTKKFMMPALELGGKDAAYVHEDADVDYAVSTIVDGAMFNSGQSCCGMERAYVHESVYEKFLEKAKILVDQYKLGDPKDESTTLGPLATPRAATYMQKQIDDAKRAGAKILAGGHIKNINQSTFYEATLICDVDHEMELMKEENFGPILPVMKVNGLDEAIDLVNDSEYGLTSAIFTNDINCAKKFSQQVNTGTVFMNRCDYLDPALAWTGVKNSGCGSSLSKYGFYSVTRRKSLHFKLKI